MWLGSVYKVGLGGAGRDVVVSESARSMEIWYAVQGGGTSTHDSSSHLEALQASDPVLATSFPPSGMMAD